MEKESRKTQEENIVSETEAREADKRSQIAAVKFLRRHMDEVKEAPELGGIEDIEKLLGIVDDKLDFKFERDTTVIRTLVDTYCELNNIDPKSITAEVLFKMIDIMLYIQKERDPRHGWNNDMAQQSTLEMIDRYCSLVGVGGFWETKIEPDKATETHGAREMKRALLQTVIEIAEVQKKYATETLPMMSKPPDASKRARYQKDAEDFLDKAEAGGISSEQEDQDLAKSRADGKFIFSPLFKFKDGKCVYREYESLLKMPIRVYRESNDGKRLQYADIPFDEIMAMETNEIRQMMGPASFEIVKRKWINLDTLPDLDVEAPAVSISLGGFPKPDSPLFFHSRSGQNMMHLHYNYLNNQMSVGYAHASIDGEQGMDWSLAIAEAVGATKARENGLEIEWYPPNIFAERITKGDIQKVIDLISSSTDRDKYVDEDAVFQMVNVLRLSDVNIGNELNQDVYDKVKKTVDLINSKYWAPADKKLKEMIQADRKNGVMDLDKKAEGYILYRLANSKMTMSKYFNLMARQFYGPSTACFVPREKESRLELLLFQAMPEVSQFEVRTYSSRKENDLNAKVFSSEKESDVDLENEIKKSFEKIKTVFGQAWLRVSVLTSIKQSNAPMRETSELLASIVRDELYKASLVEIQTSDMGLAERKDGEKVVARVAKFVSALTAAKEEARFGKGKSSESLIVDGNETVVFNDRIRLTASSLDRFRMSKKKAITASLIRVARVLGRENPEEEENILRMGKIALGLCVDGREKAYGKKSRGKAIADYEISNCLVVANAMEKIYDFDDKRRVEAFKGLQYLVIAGMLDEQERFYDTCGAAAVEMAEVL